MEQTSTVVADLTGKVVSMKFDNGGMLVSSVFQSLQQALYMRLLLPSAF